MKNYYTKKQYEELLKSMVILVDTAEKSNQHIIDWFDKHNIKWKSKSLKTGDYGCMIPSNLENGFVMDTYFNDSLTIERKNSVDEIAGNLARSSTDNDRFLREIGRMKDIRNNYLLIEGDDISSIIEGKYRSQLNASGFLRTLFTIQKQTNLHIYFVPKKYMGYMIYEICKHQLDEVIMK